MPPTFPQNPDQGLPIDQKSRKAQSPSSAGVDTRTICVRVSEEGPLLEKIEALKRHPISRVVILSKKGASIGTVSVKCYKTCN